ncbi:DUF5723 family protein [Tellurirhabdus rosea]|uniref:DUF5723 family protein n=1 Tax=Tellurirhabdus rosea TaxID=2674997 RepID=UPI002254D85A|nr:DUF5723 family protein [Tellurirhabdus rosea]
MRHSHLICFLFLFFSPLLKAQPLPGLSSSNYGGLYRVLQNPSAAAGSRYRYHLIPAAGISTVNPTLFRYFNSNDYFGQLRLPYSDQLARDLRGIGSVTNAPATNGWSELIGPSVLVSLGRAHAIAVHTRIRSYLTGSSLPEPLTNAYRRGLYSRVLQPAEGSFDFNLANESYAEAGLTYGLQVFNGELHRLRIGGTLRRIVAAQRRTLTAAGQYAIQTNAGTNEKTLSIQNAAFMSQSSVPRQGFRLSGDDLGTGWAYDLGATYEIGYQTSDRRNRSAAGLDDLRPAYILRLSAALLNNGQIDYRSGTSQSGSFSQDFNQDELDRFGNAPLEYLASRSNSTGQYLAETVNLPRTMHLEADLRLSPAFYVNALRVQNLGGREVYPSQLIITPRFEDEDSEIALPVSFIGPDNRVAVGLSARLGPIAVGMSDLNHFFNRSAENRSTVFWLGISAWKLQSVKN